MSNLFYYGFFNLQYVNSDYYHQNQEQIAQYEQKQSEEIQNVVKAVHNFCKAVIKLHPQHQRQAFGAVLAVMALEFEWKNR